MAEPSGYERVSMMLRELGGERRSEDRAASAVTSTWQFGRELILLRQDEDFTLHLFRQVAESKNAGRILDAVGDLRIASWPDQGAV